MANVRLSGPRLATIFLNDRGYIDRVFKSVKAGYPFCICTIIDRERVEIKIPRISEDFRVVRAEQVAKTIRDTRKELKKFDLSVRKDFKEIDDRVKGEFQAANALLDDAEIDAIDRLGLEEFE